MVSLILGNKGSGKTKQLIERCNKATAESKGNVVLIEKDSSLVYNVRHKTRLVSADEYGIRGYDAFYGFISGMCAGNYDITDVFIDSTLKIGGSLDGLEDFINKLQGLAKKAEKRMVLTVSADKSDLPESLAALAD